VDRCTRGRSDDTSPRVDVLLIGDSHADSLSDGVLAATERLGLSLGVWTVRGQPPHGDQAWVDAFVRLIGTTRPDVVIVATRSSNPQYLGGELLERWEPDGLGTDGDVPVEQRWVESVRDAVVRYRAAGPHVIWVQSVPEYPDGTGEREDGPTLLFLDRGFRSLSPSELDEQRGSVILEERRALGTVGGVTVLDPADRLCTPDCWSGRDGTFYYYDDNHLTPQGSRLLTEAFEEAIRSGLAARTG
jgi:hypothetical protein